MNAVAYCRVSTNVKDQLNSLETQREFFKAYAEKAGYRLLRVYSDKGRSGTQTAKRDDFNSMMRDARSGAFQVVLVKDISRLARNTVDLLQCCRELRGYGVEVQFVGYQMNNLGNSEFLLTLYAAIAQEESCNTSQRIKFSKKHNAENGRVPNLVYGYQKIKDELFQLQIDPTESGIVRDIFKQYTENGDGTLKIAQRLNAAGVKTKRGKAWTQNAVARVLCHRLYIGDVVGGKEEIVNFPNSKRVKKQESEWIVTHNESLRILDDDTFLKAQEILKARSDAFRTENKRHSNAHLFSTLIRCKECGWSFRRTVKTYRNTYVRWVCSARNGHGASACHNAAAIDEAALTEALQSYFAQLLQNEEQITERVLNEFEQAYCDGRETRREEAALDERIQELTKRKEREMALFANGFLTMDELEMRIGHIKTELPLLEEKRRVLSDGLPTREAIHKALLSVCRDTKAITDLSQMSNAALKRIVKEITVDCNGRVDIYLNQLNQGLPEN